MAYKDAPGMGRIASLYTQLPQRKKARPSQPQASALTDGELEGQQQTNSRRPSLAHQLPSTASSGPSLSMSNASDFLTTGRPRKEKTRGKPFSIEKEKTQLLQSLASSSIASTNLMNALKRVNRESHRVSEDRDVMTQAETCTLLRGQILRYIQHVESEEWLGGLIHANEELVNALMAFEVLDKSVEDDSDSDDVEGDHHHDRRHRHGHGPDHQDPSDETIARGEGGAAGSRPRRSSKQGPTSPFSTEFTDSFAGLMLAADDRPARPPRPESSKPVIRRSSLSSPTTAAATTTSASNVSSSSSAHHHPTSAAQTQSHQSRIRRNNKGKEKRWDDGFDEEEEDEDEEHGSSNNDDDDDNAGGARGEAGGDADDPFADRNAI